LSSTRLSRRRCAVITQPLRDEHKELLPHVEKLKEVADLVGSTPGAALARGLREVTEFLTAQLIPHAQAEEGALYPAVQRVMAAGEATATMSRDHEEVGALSAELVSRSSQLPAGQIPEQDARELRRLLYGLYALVRVHFAKEEQVYLPLLDRSLSLEEGRALFTAMEKEAATARHHAQAEADEREEGERT
jgi:iron-sulfur cluster repair protein YtfE (RIC family)